MAVGIDLGTSNSCIAICKNGKVEIIQNEENSYVIPSCVSFTEDGVKVGNEAKNEAHKYVKNTIFEIKRFMGQRFEDPKVQEDIKRFPYEVINDNGIPKVRVNYRQKEENCFAEEISAYILRKLKDLAESRLGQVLNQVVVTVPAYFNDLQRQATKDAAAMAGFTKVNIINEPTAAALAFTFQNRKPHKRNVLVYDFGGGTFDVSIVTVQGERCEVKATKGDLHLGGTDIDYNLVNFVKKDFNEKFGVQIQESDIIMRRLKNACEMTKKRLSGQKSATDIELNNISGKDYISSITKIQFEKINANIFEATLKIVSECLEDSKLTKEQIDEVVLVGGSTRIPKVQQILEEYFGQGKINKGVNPDEAVAYGAAIHAINLTGNKEEVIQDVISLPFGTAVLGFISSVIIPANTPVPTEFTQIYYTVADNQTAAKIIVHQGSSVFVRDNNQLATFILTGLRKAPAGHVKIEICFKVDSEGILDVTASEIGAGNSKSIQIDVSRKGLTADQIRQRNTEIEQNCREEQRKEAFDFAKYKLENMCSKVLGNAGRIKDANQRDTILTQCDEISKWLENVSLCDKDAIELKKKILEDLYNEGVSDSSSK